MQQNNGFVDLRMHHQQQGDEGFWPSFTDIMTVILMIFLLAMLTLLIRNMDLVNQLRQSLLAEQQASQELASTSSQNSELNQKLSRLENEVAMMRMQLMDVGDEKVKAEAKLKAAQLELVHFRQMQQQWQLAESTLRQQLGSTQQQYSALEQQQAALKLQWDALQMSLDEKSNAYAQLMQQTGTQKEQLDRLQQEYADLDEKYKKLIRPARSTLGKYVVMVRYQKTDGKLTVEMKESKDTEFRQVTGIEMHKQLAVLQKQHRKDLYVKIVFPDDSGLSYNEAWNLTESLLKMYDYYCYVFPCSRITSQ